MDAPVQSVTSERARLLAEQIVIDTRDLISKEAGQIGAAMAACLRVAAAGELLFVFVVPTAMAAGELLLNPRSWTRASLNAALYELETLLPKTRSKRDPKNSVPDVPISSLTTSLGKELGKELGKKELGKELS